MKIQLKFNLLPLFLLLLFQTTSYAATFTWTGNANSEWNNLNNWSGGIFLDLIPNADDDVIIPTGLTNYPEIGGSVTQSIRILSMVVESGATVTVASQGTLRVFGPLGDGIDNAGTITNNGIIRIRDAGARGLDNNSGATFTNDGTLDIGTNNQPTQDNGIVNRGANTSFQNNGSINIEQVNASAISNESSASFLNANGASINIGQNSGNISGSGIRNTFFNTIFTNSGTINIDNTSSDGVDNQNDANFSNTANANINIGQNDGNIGGDGIANIFNSTTFDNNGTISIDNTSFNGIENQFGATFSNTANANLNIGQNAGNIGGNGIYTEDNNTLFTNIGAIAIDQAVGNAVEIQDDSVFDNKGGIINIENSNNSSNSAIALLSGSQFIDSTGTISLGQNQPFTGTAFEIVDATFTGNDTTAIHCVGDFVIGLDGIVHGIGQLNLEGNWENNGIFIADSSLVTILGNTQSSIGGDSTSTFFDLNISNSGNIILENEVTINRGLTLYEGKVNLGNNNFVLGNDYELSAQVGTSALVTNGTGEVISTIANGASRIFPVGNTNYTPITIQNDGTSDDFSVQCLPEVLSDGTIGNVFPTAVVNTTWLIEEAVAGGTDATLMAQWTSAEELPSFDRNNTFLARYDGTAWDSSTPIAASGTDPYTITRAGITTFSPFAVGTSFVPDFDCVDNGLELNEVALASGTYSTQQSIESTNLIEAGSTVDFIAANVIELKVGFHAENGSIFSAVIDDCTLPTAENEVIEQRTDRGTESIERTALPLLFPNPVGQELNIQDGIGQAVIYNMLGQEIQTFEIRDDLHTLDVSDLVSGQYVLLILRESGERVTLSFVK